PRVVSAVVRRGTPTFDPARLGGVLALAAGIWGVPPPDEVVECPDSAASPLTGAGSRRGPAASPTGGPGATGAAPPGPSWRPGPRPPGPARPAFRTAARTPPPTTRPAPAASGPPPAACTPRPGSPHRLHACNQES